MSIEGNLISSNEAMREGAKAFYQNLYKEEFLQRLKLDNLSFERLDNLERNQLEAPFFEEEILDGLRSYDVDKAPGPNSFNLKFLQNFWLLIKDDVIEMFTDFHRSGSFVKYLNATFIVLVPKKEGAKCIGDLRPVSLISSLYKVIAKALANGLSRVLHLIIDGSQHAFVASRQISDAFMIANGDVDEMVHNKRLGILCKLNMEKASDHVC